MITASYLFAFAALAALVFVARQEFGRPGNDIVMKAEGDGGSNGGSDDLGWGGGDIDLPF